MRIEILVDGSVEPQIYPINKQKLMLGSGETCDVVISSDNISRKHLMIISEGDSFFVVDQGSTNGTYINEERLVPGRRTEFTSFFPVRLGDQVLITLLSDADLSEPIDPEPLIPAPKPAAAPARGGDESTKMISLADLKKAKTSDLQARRQETIKKKASTVKRAPPKSKRAKENQNFKFLVWALVIAVAGIGYYNVKSVKEEAPVAKMGESVAADPLKPVAEKTVTPDSAQASEGRIVPDSELFDKQRYLTLVGDARCVTDIEKYFCGAIPGASDEKFGVVQIGNSIHIMIDGEPYIKEARNIVVHPPADASGNYPPEIYEPYKKTVMDTALALFFMKAWPKNLDPAMTKDVKIFIALFEIWQGTTYIQRVAAAYPEMLPKYQGFVNQIHIDNVKEVGDGALEFTKQYYKTY